MREKMISVAMTTYNGEKFVIQQLESIKNQSMNVDEVIICDDQSTDNTCDIISHYIFENGLQNWKLVVNDKRLGYAQNFLKAIKLTKGSLIFLSDQDDIWLENKVESMSKEFESNPTMEYLHTNIALIDQNGKRINNNYKYNRKTNYNISFFEFSKRINYCGMSSAFTEEIRNKLALLNDIEIAAHDWLLPALAVIDKGFCISTQIYTLRRFHGNNVALQIENSTSKEKSKAQRILMAEKYIQYYSELIKVFEDNNYLEVNKEDLNILRKFEETAEKRRCCLVESNMKQYIYLLRDIRYFPNAGIYMKDMIYLLKSFKEV